MSTKIPGMVHQGLLVPQGLLILSHLGMFFNALLDYCANMFWGNILRIQIFHSLMILIFYGFYFKASFSYSLYFKMHFHFWVTEDTICHM